MVSSSNMIHIDVMSELDSPKITLALNGLKSDISQKEIVVFLRGHRQFGSWKYSKVFQGAFKYFGERLKDEAAEMSISDISQWLPYGIRIGVSTFGDGKGALKDVVDSVEIKIVGLKPHTCEYVIESFKHSFVDTSINPQLNVKVK